MAYVHDIVGFWGSAHTLLAVGQEKAANPQDTRLTFAGFDVRGKPTTDPIYSPDRTVWIDAAHNRAWRAVGKTCKVIAFPITPQSNPSAFAADFDTAFPDPCEVPIGAIHPAFIGTGVLLGARLYGRGAKVLARIDLSNQTVSKVVVSTPPAESRDEAVEVGGSLLTASGDGRFAVLVIHFEHYDRAYTVRKKTTRVYLIETNPLRIIKQEDMKGCDLPQAITLDQQEKTLSAIVRSCNTWKTITAAAN